MTDETKKNSTEDKKVNTTYTTDGRIVSIPFSVGDDVWYVYNPGVWRISKHTIARFSYNSNGSIGVDCDWHPYWRKSEFFFSGRDIGNNIFFSEEEAQEALNRKKEEWDKKYNV